MNGVSRFFHIKAGGFYASGRIRAGDIKLGNIILFDKRRTSVRFIPLRRFS